MPPGRLPCAAGAFRRPACCGLLILAAAGLAAACLYSQQRGAADSLLKEGFAALARGDAALAVEKCRLAVSRAPMSVAGWRLLANAAEQDGDRALAISALARLVEIDRTHAADDWMRIGGLEMKRYRIRNADRALRQALEIDPV